MQLIYRRTYWRVISIKLLCNFIEIAIWLECSIMNTFCLSVCYMLVVLLLCFPEAVSMNTFPKADLGLLQHPRWNTLEALNYYHKELHLECCSSPRSASAFVNDQVNIFCYNSQPEKCPYTEFFLVRIFLYSDWIRRFDSIRSKPPYSKRMQENLDQKKLRIWTLFTQWTFKILYIDNVYFLCVFVYLRRTNVALVW